MQTVDQQFVETFDEVWQTSLANSWSYAYPVVLWSGVTSLTLVSLIRHQWLRRAVTLILVLGLTVAATWSSSREIQEKWRIRSDWAYSHEDQMTAAHWDALTADGKDLLLGPLVNGFLACVLFIAVCTVLTLVRFALVRCRKSTVDHCSPFGEVP